jgi:hypothetical protein
MDRIELDPKSDHPVKLADEIVDLRDRAGGRLVEHWYTPKKGEYQAVTVDVAAPRFERKVVEKGAPVRVTGMRASQETVYDSVIDIHEFVTRDMGLPLVFDTSAGKSVWNYPVNHIRVDREREVERTEGGARAVYTTYHLVYTTFGGPKGDVRYIVKRDDGGNAVRAVALDPMPDFAFRNEHWVCAPVVDAGRGQPAYNVAALEAGYGIDKARQRVVTDLWSRLALLLYAGLGVAATGAKVFVFETEGGEAVALAEADFEAAVKADVALRG